VPTGGNGTVSSGASRPGGGVSAEHGGQGSTAAGREEASGEAGSQSEAGVTATGATFEGKELPDVINFDRLGFWYGNQREEFPLRDTASDESSWSEFSLTAALGHTLPDSHLDPNDRIQIVLPVPVQPSAALTYGDRIPDFVVPLMDLGPVDDYGEEKLHQLCMVISGVTDGTNWDLSGDMPAEFGESDGQIWARPDIANLKLLTMRLLSELIQNGFRPQTPLPAHCVMIGSADALPPSVFDTPPQHTTFDTLWLTVGEEAIDFHFGGLTATGFVEFADLPLPPDVAHPVLQGEGGKFFIPLLVPEGVPTGDGRIFEPLSLKTRDLPISLLWQIKTDEGHDGSAIVGRIDSIERVTNGLGNARGVFDIGPYGKEAERLVRGGFLRGVSADLDQFEAVAEEDGEDSQTIEVVEAPKENADGAKPKIRKMRTRKITSPKVKISSARVMAATLVPKPAFQECYIELADSPAPEKEPLVADGIYLARPDEALVACALIASSIPTEPPAVWFENPRLVEPTPLTVTDDGRVFGHIAAWHVDHIGLPFGTKPPRSRSGYAYFHTGVVRTTDGKDVPVGQLTLAGGHAPLDASALAAVKHYDDTASGVADVHAGEDSFGIWVSGALRPGTTPEQIRVLRASAPSGDWRPIQGRLELVAVCQVNVPGFPVAKARVASGYVTALVAAGAQSLAELRAPSVEDRITALEAERDHQRWSDDAELVKLRMAPLAASAAEDILARSYTDAQRTEMALAGSAMKDGSYPIDSEKDLKNAIKAYGRAPEGKRAAVRRHIRSMAKKLGKSDLIPGTWNEASAVRAEFAVVAALMGDESTVFRNYSKKAREEYSKKGWALEDGSYPVRDVGDLRRAVRAFGRAPKDKKPAVKRHIIKRARGLNRPDLIPDSWKETAILRSRVELRREHPDLEYVSDGVGMVASLLAGLRYQEPREFKEELHPRSSDTGQFVNVLARLKSQLKGQLGTQEAQDKLQEAQDAVDQGDMDQAQRKSNDLLQMVDKISSGAIDEALRIDLRRTSDELGQVMARLPVAQGDLSKKYRFTDLPEGLQNLVHDLLDRLDRTVGSDTFDSVAGPLRSYMSGGDVMSSDEIQSYLSRILRYLVG
jgi:hypothetical protein